MKYVCFIALFFASNSLIAQEHGSHWDSSVFLEELSGYVQETGGSLRPVHACHHSKAPTSNSTDQNFKDHECNNNIQKNPLNDFYAYSCTCPTPDKRLRKIRKIEKKYEDKYEKITSKENLNDKLEKDKAIIKEHDRLFKKSCDKCLEENKESNTINIASFSSCVEDIKGTISILDREQRLYKALLKSGWKDPEKDRSARLFRSISDYQKFNVEKKYYEKVCSSPINFRRMSDYVDLLVRDYNSEILRPKHPRSLKEAMGISRTLKAEAAQYGIKIKKHVVPNKVYLKVQTKLNEASRKLYSKRFDKKVFSMFSKLKDKVINYLKPKLYKRLKDCSKNSCKSKAQTLDEKLNCNMKINRCDEATKRVKKRIQAKLDKLKNIKLKKCEGPAMAKMANGTYNYTKNSMCYGAPYQDLVRSSPETVERFLLHELGHAVEMSDVNIEDTLMRCLKSDSSVAALEGSPVVATKIDGHVSFGKDIKDKRTVIVTPAKGKPHKYLIPKRLDLNVKSGDFVKAGTELTFGEGDQTGEAFADWFAVEIAAQKIGSKKKPKTKKKYRNIAIGMCEGGYPSGSKPAKLDPHPTSPDRFNKILAVHPNVRAAFDALPLKKYDPQSTAKGLSYCPSPEVW